MLQSVIRDWPQHPKRERILKLFEAHDIDARITVAIDETFSEDQGKLLSLLNLDLEQALLAVLTAQVASLQTSLVELQQATTPSARAAALALLCPAASTEPDTELMFDVFNDSLLSVDDLELTVAAIVVFGILKQR